MSGCKKDVCVVEKLGLINLMMLNLKHQHCRIVYCQVSWMCRQYTRMFPSKLDIIRLNRVSLLTPACCDVVSFGLTDIVEGFYSANAEVMSRAFSKATGQYFKTIGPKKIEIVIKKLILSMLQKKQDFIFSILSHHDCQHQVIVYDNFIHYFFQFISEFNLNNFILKKAKPDFIDVCATFAFYVKFIVKKVALVFYDRLSRIFRRKSRVADRDSSFISSDGAEKSCMLFMHKGPVYGDLFFKDFYYSMKRPQAYAKML